MPILVFLLILCLPLAGAPQRIVSTAPSITEMLFALGLGDRVVGVTNYCQYPPEVSTRPRIGTYLQPNVERILELRPDLVIIPKTPLHTRTQYDAVKLKTLEVKYDSIADIEHSIRDISVAAGVPESGTRLNQKIRDGLQAVAARAPIKRPSVLFIVGRTPGALDGLVTVGTNSYLDEVIKISGGKNIFEGTSQSYFRISMEEVLSRGPEIIIDMGDMGEARPVTPEYRQSVLKLWSRFPSIPAVRSVQVHPVSSPVFVVHGPRVVELAEILSKLIH